eukprot:393722_1
MSNFSKNARGPKRTNKRAQQKWTKPKNTLTMQKLKAKGKSSKSNAKIMLNSNLIIEQQNTFTKFQGSALFRWRLLLATLTHKSICIDNIRIHEDNPGLKDYELSFLKLLDQLTNGSLIEINETGTKIRYKPGTLIGSSSILYFKCCTSR